MGFRASWKEVDYYSSLSIHSSRSMSDFLISRELWDRVTTLSRKKGILLVRGMIVMAIWIMFLLYLGLIVS